MRTYTYEKYGRTIVMHLGKGEKVLECIKSECERLGVKNAVLLSCIGSLRHAQFHIITTTEDKSTDDVLVLDTPMEVSAVQGIIANGQPHFHMVISDPERVYTGHMEENCETQYLMEIAILEVLDMNLIRKQDEFGIWGLMANE
jgi:predicted DNA-binding protein with PD1-like motif